MKKPHPKSQPQERPRRSQPADTGSAIPAVVGRAVAEGVDAWPAFIEAYSDFILACIGRLASCADERMEIYVHVCARLHADDCRRLAQFRGHSEAGPCRFTTWLATVVLNLSREWIRVSKGRRRMFRPLMRLSMMDQLVFRYHHWENYPAEQIAPLLRCNHGLDVTAGEVEEAFTRIRQALTPLNRWRLVSAHNRQRGAENLDASPKDGGSPRWRVPHPGPRPDVVVGREQATRILAEAVETLAPLERRALRLRFMEGRTAKEAASELGISNYKRVYEVQARALVKLRRRLRERGVRLSDFGRGVDSLEALK